MEQQNPKTVAIIMDGNGRWAKKRGLPRTAGHQQGAENIRNIALGAKDLGIQKLILYAFSTENWKRPEDEKSYLFKLPGIFFNKYIKELQENNIRVTYAGELDKFPESTQKVIRKAIEDTQTNDGLELSLAINYGARRELLLAFQNYAFDVSQGYRENNITEEEISSYLMVPEDIDLMIRTSGEERISNFLLWQIAYSELIFTEVAWPDFTVEELKVCLDEFKRRDRRYGGLSQ